MAVVLIIISLFCFSMAIYKMVDEKKKAKEAGMCCHCNKVKAAKELPNGKYACKECYKILAPKLREEYWKEQERKEQLEKEKLAEEKPVYIHVGFGTRTYNGGFNTGVPDSAGGWDVTMTIENNTDKRVKYVFVELIPYNTVGDVGYSPTVRAGAKTVQVTGPIEPYSTLYGQVVEKCWYEIKMARVKVGKVRIVFMNGTEKTFVQK